MLRKFIGFMVLALVLSITAESQAKIIKLNFVIDEQASSVRIDGDVQGIDIEGDQVTAVGGTLDVRVLVKGKRAIGFIIDRSEVNQLDAIDLIVPNPIWFLPPIAEFSITDLSLAVTTGGVRFGQGLSFSTNTGRIEVLSGMAEGELLGDPIGPFDLSGNIQEDVPIDGAMSVVGDEVRIEFPISQQIEIPDVPGTFFISGVVVAYAPLGG